MPRSGLGPIPTRTPALNPLPTLNPTPNLARQFQLAVGVRWRSSRCVVNWWRSARTRVPLKMRHVPRLHHLGMLFGVHVSLAEAREVKIGARSMTSAKGRPLSQPSLATSATRGVRALVFVDSDCPLSSTCRCSTASTLVRDKGVQFNGSTRAT